jgi:hypothetical protein
VLVAQVVRTLVAIIAHKVIQTAFLVHSAARLMLAATIRAARIQRAGVTVIATRPIQTASDAIPAIGFIGAAAVHA